MVNQEIIKKAVHDGIDEVNSLLPDNQRITIDDNTNLFSEDSSLDSLSLINLLVAIEEKLKLNGFEINLTDDELYTENENPLETIGTLITFLDGYFKKMEEKK